LSKIIFKYKNIPIKVLLRPQTRDRPRWGPGPLRVQLFIYFLQLLLCLIFVVGLLLRP